MKTSNQKGGSSGLVMLQPGGCSNRVVRSGDENRLQGRTQCAFNRPFPLSVNLNCVGEGPNQMKIFTEVSRKSLLDSQRVMSPALIQLLKAFQSMQRARMFVSHPCLFRVGIGNSLVSFNDCFQGGLALGNQSRKLFSLGQDLPIQPFGFSASLEMRRCGTFAFARQAIRLLGYLLQTVLELASQFTQPFGSSRVCKQLNPGALDIIFCFRNRGQLLSMGLFGRSQGAGCLLAFQAESRVQLA